MPKTFEPNSESQANFLIDTARFSALVGGIGSGKTTGGVVKAIMKLKDGDGIMVSPEFPHFSRSLWPVLSKYIPWSRVTNSNLNHPHTQRKVLELDTIWGPRKIYYGGMKDPGSFTGPTVNWVHLDEARRYNTRQAFDVLAGRIRRGNNPQLWITTTPRGMLRGRAHWLKEVFIEQKFPQEILDMFEDSEQTLVKCYHLSTKDNAKNLDKMYYASLRALYTGRYAKQELEGQFVIFAGQVFDNFSEERNTTEKLDYNPNYPVLWGVDDGYTKGHPRVILFAQIIPPIISIFDSYVATYERAEDSIRHALEKGYQKPIIARVDSSAAEFRGRLWDLGIETSAASHRVEEGIKHARAFFGDENTPPHLVFHKRNEFAINQIQAYCYPDTVETTLSESSPRAAKPVKESDDVADALRYLVWPESIKDLDRRAKNARRYGEDRDAYIKTRRELPVREYDSTDKTINEFLQNATSEERQVLKLRMGEALGSPSLYRRYDSREEKQREWDKKRKKSRRWPFKR